VLHLHQLAFTGFLLGVAVASHAQIQIHAPGAPGGPTHMLGLEIARALESASGDRVTVIGSNPLAAPAQAADAPADGRTLLLADPETSAQLAQQGGDVTLRDKFVEIARVGSRPYGLYTGVNSPVPMSADQIATAINSGSGFLIHHNLSTRACAEVLRSYLNVPPSKMLGYQGQGPALVDLMSRQSFFYCGPMLSRAPGGIRLIAVSRRGNGQQRGNVPTFADLGIPLNQVFTTGIFARRDTPTATLEHIRSVVAQALSNPDLVASLTRQDFTPPPAPRTTGQSPRPPAVGGSDVADSAQPASVGRSAAQDKAVINNSAAPTRAGAIGSTRANSAPTSVAPEMAGGLLRLHPVAKRTSFGHLLHGTPKGLACIESTGRRDSRGRELFRFTCQPIRVTFCAINPPDPHNIDSSDCRKSTVTIDYFESKIVTAGYSPDVTPANVPIPLGYGGDGFERNAQSIFVASIEERCAQNLTAYAPVPNGWLSACHIPAKKYDEMTILRHMVEERRKAWGQ